MKLKKLILFMGIILSINCIKSQLTHDIAVGPFIHFPCQFKTNIAYNIQTRIQNVGTSNETNVPIRCYISGTLVNTVYKNLLSGQIDSILNIWTPIVAGTYTLMYVSSLASDENRSNDTVRTTVDVLASYSNLCEGFTNTTFPPLCWVKNDPGNYLNRANLGNGQGCVIMDFYSAPNGYNADLYTSLFGATNGNDSLHFTLAYCQWAAWPNDSLMIYTSTDAGTTWTSLVKLGELQLNTASASCTHPFTPANSDWGRRAFVIPAGTNKINFHFKSGFGDHLYIDSVGTNSCWNYIDGITNNGNSFPKSYSLSQNYPNPFNPTTMINFSLPKAGNVKLIVYDILGSQVATLVNEHKEAGNYDISFDGSNFASGVYFYKIEAGSFTDVKKMVLMK